MRKNQFWKYLTKNKRKLFLKLFEDVRYDITLILALSLTDGEKGILKQSGFTEEEIKIFKLNALQNYKSFMTKIIKEFKR